MPKELPQGRYNKTTNNKTTKHMKKLITALFAVAVISFIAPSLQAGDITSTNLPAMKHTDRIDLAGTITAVDVNYCTLTVTADTKNDTGAVTMFLKANTHIVKNGQPATMRDLTIGDRCIARYIPRTLSSNVAISVFVPNLTGATVASLK